MSDEDKTRILARGSSVADEDKTRILTRGEAEVDDERTRILGRGRSTEPPAGPQRLGDKVVFFCRNGHKLVVPAKLGGQRGLCTKCKAPVLIPKVPVTFGMPGEAVEEPAADELPGFSFAPPADEVEGPLPGLEGDAGPAEIADVGGEPAAEVGADEAPQAPDWPFVTGAKEPAGDLEIAAPAAAESEPPIWPAAPSSALGFDAPDSPVAQLVARLWVERGHGGIVELHLRGGGVILPEWYEPNWSRGTHGLFASQAADGSVTLTAVAWETVEKVVVRQVQGLPDGMFE